MADDPGGPASDSGDATDELYGLDPNDFVAGRNEMVRRLRRAGDRRLSTEMAKLRRPTPAAWAVNQLTRRHRGEVEELAGLGEVLRAAQDGALAGARADDLRQAGRARRDAVARLADLAGAILAERGGGGGPGAHAGEVAATLEAASLDAEAAAAVLAGRLSVALRPPSGFGVFDPPGVTTSTSSKPEPAPEPDPSERARREAQEAADEARHAWEERSARARAAVDEVVARRQVTQTAVGEVARVEDLLSAAQSRLRAAVREQERTEDAASRAEEVAARAVAALREADRRLADLGGE